MYEYQGFRIREDMLAALTEYVERGVPVGDFLRAVICNDLVAACGQADSDNLKNIPAFAGWLYNRCPSGAWGTVQAYHQWLDKHRIERAAYTGALRAHDWTFEHSDDQRVWLAGTESLKTLRTLQPRIDPRHVLWNSIAPEGHRC